MAKIAFTKLGLKPNTDIKSIIVNEQEVEIKQYLPVNEKLELVSRILNNSADDMKFYNTGKLELFFALEVILTYTNISLTEKQKENSCKLYDLFVSSGFYYDVMSNIPSEELSWIHDTMLSTVDSIYKYQNSVMGILDTVTADYDGLNLDASTIQSKLADPENLELLKTVMTKLG